MEKTGGIGISDGEELNGKRINGAMSETTEKIIVIGASTGGTEALGTFLKCLPADAPGIVVVQHMPEQYAQAFIGRMNRLCRVSVRKANDGDRLCRGTALIAPADFHILLKRDADGYYVEVIWGPLINLHRPSADILFRSASRYAGADVIGIIMTGMGKDGAAGLKEMRDAGAVTLAQNEESCVLFGMGREAIKLNAVEYVLPLKDLAPAALKACGRI